MMQAQLFMDEMSMIGRQMMGKIEFRVKDTLKGTVPRDRVGKYLGGRDAVLAGDPKQAPPICDEPIYRVGEYKGPACNKPKGAERTPSDAWSTHNLVRNGMEVRDSFKDAVLLRQVHRYVDEKSDVAVDKREEYKKDAPVFLTSPARWQIAHGRKRITSGCLDGTGLDYSRRLRAGRSCEGSIRRRC